jgi:hypothetical protein
MKHFIFSIISGAILMLAPFISFAQNTGAYSMDELQSLYDSTIILQQSGGFELNGEMIRYGLFRKNLKNELKRSESGWESFRLYRKRILIGTALTIGSVPVLLIISAATLNPSIGAMAALPPYLAGFVIIGTSTNFYQRSIWLYNRDAISGNLKDP